MLNARFLMIASGIGLVALGFMVALNPMHVKVQSCIDEVGCFNVAPIVSPSVGLGLVVTFVGFVTLMYGYIREEEAPVPFRVDHL